MEFEFKTSITGQPIAKCELECEAFGDWLSHDLGNNPHHVSKLLTTVEQLLSKQIQHVELPGKEYHLSIEDDEVSISLNHAQSSSEEFAEQASNHQTTGCGLVDFQQLLKAWLEFIGG